MVFKIQPWLSFSFFKRMVKQPWLDRLMIFAKKWLRRVSPTETFIEDCVFTGIKGGSFYRCWGKGVKRQLNTNASYKLNSKLERCFMWSQSIGNLPSEIMSSFVVETCIPLSTACSLPICLHMVFAIPFHKLSSYIVFIAFGISGVHYCDPAGPIHRLRRRPRMLKKNAKKKHLRPTSRFQLKGFPVDRPFLSGLVPKKTTTWYLVVVFPACLKKKQTQGVPCSFSYMSPTSWGLPAAEPLWLQLGVGVC